MQVSIYSLKRILFAGVAQSLNCKTSMGEITVLDHHRPLISVLENGTIKVIGSDNQESYFPVTGGFLKVGTHNDVMLIVDE